MASLDVTGADQKARATRLSDLIAAFDPDTTLPDADRVRTSSVSDTMGLLVVDITGTHQLPAGSTTSPLLAVDFSIPRAWVKHRRRIAGTAATATGTNHTHADYLGAFSSPPAPLDHVSDDVAGLYYYNRNLHQWYRRITVSGSSFLFWDHVSFDQLISTSYWLYDRASANEAAEHIVTYDSSLAYYFYNTSNRHVQRLSSYVAPANPSNLFQYDSLSDTEFHVIEDAPLDVFGQEGDTTLSTGTGAVSVKQGGEWVVEYEIENRYELEEVEHLALLTDDLSNEHAKTWAAASATDAAFTLFAGSGATLAEIQAATFVTTHTYTNLDASSDFMVFRLSLTDDKRDYRALFTEDDDTERRTNGGTFSRLHSSDTTYAYYGREVWTYPGGTLTIEKATVTSYSHYRGRTDANRVQVAASGFSGNLETTDTDLQAALSTIDGLSLGSGSGSGSGSGTEDLLDEVVADGDPVVIGTTAGVTTSTVASFQLTAQATSTVVIGDFLQLNDEIALVTLVSNNQRTFTVTRGVFGTDAATHADATSVSLLQIGAGRNINIQTWVYDSSTNQNVFDLGRGLTDDDDDGILNADLSWISASIRHYDHWDIGVRQLRRMQSHALEGDSLHETSGHVVTRSNNTGLVGAAIMEFVYAHRRLTAQDETDGLGIEGNDALVVAIRSANQAVTLTNVQMHIYISNEGAGGGQQSPGATSAGNGGSFVKKYQRVASGTTPSDPPDIYDSANDEYEEDFGDWEEEVPTGTDILWVADGGTVIDDDDAVQNLTWRVYPVITAQYAEVFQDIDTYSDALVAASRYVRFLTATGWTAWTPIADGTRGWVNVITNQNCFVTNVSNRIDVPISGGLDATYFREIEFELLVYGLNGSNENLGAIVTTQERRRQEAWTSKTVVIDEDIGLGVFKMRYFDITGLDVVRAGGAGLSPSTSGNVGPPDTVSPYRRFTFLVSLIAASGSDGLTHVTLHNFSATNARSRISIRMR